MSKSFLDKILASPRLPTLPAVAMRVLDLTASRHVNVQQIADAVLNDQALASKILRTVNSSFYGLVRPCGTIQQAIVYLGMDTVKSLLLSFSLVDSINGTDGDNVGFDFLSYWRRSLYAASASREISVRVAQGDPEEAFLMALMQDVGMVASHRVLGDRYLQAIDLSGGDHARLIAIERRCFGTDHAEVGAKIAGLWRLPAQFVEAVRHHHDAAGANRASQPCVRIIELGGMAAAALTLDQADGALGRFTQHSRDWLDLGPVESKELLAKIAQAAEEVSILFSVHTGEPPEVDSLLAQAEERMFEHLVQKGLAPQATPQADAVPGAALEAHRSPQPKQPQRK